MTYISGVYMPESFMERYKNDYDRRMKESGLDKKREELKRGKYCLNCSQYVTPKKEFGWGSFIFWLIIGAGVGGLIYTYWFLVFKKPICPICKSRNFRQ